MARVCPKCGSSNYIETVSLERCPDCGIACDYWGGGANAAYGAWQDEEAAKEEQRRFDERWEDDRRSREEW